MMPATIFRGEHLVGYQLREDSQIDLKIKYGLGVNPQGEIVQQVALALLSDLTEVGDLISQLPPGVKERVRDNVGYPEAPYEGMELVLGRHVVTDEPIALNILFSQKPLTAAQKVYLLLSQRLAEHG